MVKSYWQRCCAVLLCTLSLTGGAPASATAGLTSPVRIAAIGDSLMAGRGLKPEEGFTAQLEAELRRRGHAVTVINASVSGDTSGDGLARLDWVLAEPYAGVILFLGYNDAFRAIPAAQVKTNLEQMIRNIQNRELPLLLAGAKAPRNLGAPYYEAFDALYPQLAEQYELNFYPFFLEGVAADASLNQRDGIHPNSKGVGVIVRNIAPYIETLLGEIGISSISIK